MKLKMDSRTNTAEIVYENVEELQALLAFVGPHITYTDTTNTGIAVPKTATSTLDKYLNTSPSIIDLPGQIPCGITTAR